MKKAMKKMSILLIFILLVTSIASANDNTKFITKEVEKASQLTVNILEKSDFYEKIEVINMSTGEIQYAESFLDGEYPRYVITTSDAQYVVEGNKEIISLYKDDDLVENFTKSEFVEIGISNESQKEITPMSYGPWGSWRYSEPNLAIVTGVPLVLAGLLAARCGLVDLSEFINIATLIISIGLSYIWLRIGTRDRFDPINQLHQTEKTFAIFLNSDRTEEWWFGSWIIEGNFMDSVPDPILASN